MKPLLSAVRLVIIYALFILSGCATIQPAKNADQFEQKPSVLGLVIASSTVNTGEIGQIYSITLDKIGEQTSKQFVLTNHILGKSRDTSLFLGAVPAGEYRIAQIGGGGKYLVLSQSPFLSNIKVNAGEVSDLGRLILTAINTQVAMGRSRQFKDNIAMFKRYLPEKSNLFDKTINTGWTEEVRQKDVVEMFALSHPQGVTALSELSDGRIVAGTRLGTVLIRSKDKKWKIANYTRDFEAIMTSATYETDNNLALVADDFGELYRLDNTLKLHSVNRGNLPYGKIVFLSHSQKYDHWFAALNRDSKVELYQTNQIESGNWAMVRSDSTANSAWAGQRFAWLWDRPTGIGYAVSGEKAVNCFDYESKQWISHKTPENRTITGLSPASTVDAFGVLTSPGGGFGGVFAKTHLTHSCGKEWMETKSPYSVKVSAPLLLPNNSIIEAGGVFKDTGIYASKDNGQNWEKITSETVLTEKLWATKNNGLFSISNGQWGIETIKNSTDGGATWELELTSYLRDFAKKTEN